MYKRQSIDFEGIGSRLLSRKPNHSVRQSFFEDFGFCTGISTSRKVDPLGISKPCIKPGTKDKIHQDLLLTCSKVIAAMGLHIFKFGEERRLTFSDDLVSGNVIEAMRLAITDESNLCGCDKEANDPIC